MHACRSPEARVYVICIGCRAGWAHQHARQVCEQHAGAKARQHKADKSASGAQLDYTPSLDCDTGTSSQTAHRQHHGHASHTA